MLLRGPLLNLPVVLATDSPPVQVVTIAMFLTMMMAAELKWQQIVPMVVAVKGWCWFC